MTSRRAFVLHVVLWVMLAAAAVSMAGALIGRDAFHAARNRLALERAHWTAFECAERTRAAVDDLLGGASDGNAAARTWRDLGPRLDAMPMLRVDGCVVRAEAAGTRADVNAVPRDVLFALLEPLGIAEWLADSMIARRPFSDVRELRVELRDLLSTEPGRISINTATPAVLTAVPGLTSEAVDAIVEARSREPIGDLLAVAGRLSAGAAAQMLARYADVARITTVDPDAWIITATAGAPASDVAATVELRLVRANRRAVVGRYRSWP